MAWDEEDDTTTYKVIINQEKEYSIWPAEGGIARGWKDVGKVGSKKECLDYIEEVWTDMSPLNRRKMMEMAARAARR